MAERLRVTMRPERRRGQPLVFLLTVLTVWSAARLAHHWPADSAAGGQATERPTEPMPASRKVILAAVSAPEPMRAGTDVMSERASSALRHAVARPEAVPFPVALAHQQLWLDAMLGAPGGPDQGATPTAPLRDGPILPPTLAPAAIAPTGSGPARPGSGRWSVYAWSLVRQGSGTRALAPAAQYGGSQAGLLIKYALGGPRHRPMLYARATGALAEADDRSLAIGLAARPIAQLPIDLAIERRFALVEGQRDRLAVMALAGGAVPIGRGGAQLEGYGQAGLVGLSAPLAFFDLRLVGSKPVHRADRLSLALGGGLWAGGQQNADGRGGKPWTYRVDIGPRAALTVPVESGSLALALDWRQRVDGDARPHSGPALTLSAGF